MAYVKISFVRLLHNTGYLDSNGAFNADTLYSLSLALSNICFIGRMPDSFGAQFNTSSSA